VDERSAGQVIVANMTPIRQQLGYSEAELAAALGKDKSYFNKVRQGSVPAWDVVQRLADLLGVSIETLTRGANSNPALPLPSVYFQRQYNIQRPDYLQFLDAVARQVRAVEVKGSGEAAPPASEEQQRSGRTPLAQLMRLFGPVVERAAEEIGGYQSGVAQNLPDPELNRLIRNWPKLSAGRKQLISGLIDQLASQTDET